MEPICHLSSKSDLDVKLYLTVLKIRVMLKMLEIDLSNEKAEEVDLLDLYC